IASAWGTNLTEGGRALIGSLQNLGSAGVEALGRLGRAGGAFAQESMQALGRMMQNGIASARETLSSIAGALTPENLRRFMLDAPVGTARAIMNALGGQQVANLFNGLTPEAIRNLYERLNWGNVWDAFARMGPELFNQTWNALTPGQIG